MKPRKIKLFWWLATALPLLLAALLMLPALWPRTLDPEECSELYRNYSDHPDIDVTFIKNFPVNDTLRLDVTFLQATDSLGWETLKNDFHVHPLPELSQLHVSQGMDIVKIKLVPKDDPTLNMDTTDLLNNNLLAISFLHRTLSIFHTSTEPEMDAIMHYQFDLSMSNINN